MYPPFHTIEDQKETLQKPSKLWVLDRMKSVWKEFAIRENDTRGNSTEIYRKCARLKLRKYAFPDKAANNWSTLSDIVVNAQNIEISENRLDKLCIICEYL